jgi:predicted methyltransferase
MEVVDINGRVVKTIKDLANEINISDLNAGVYFLKIYLNLEIGISKIIKKQSF